MKSDPYQDFSARLRALAERLVVMDLDEDQVVGLDEALRRAEGLFAPPDGRPSRFARSVPGPGVHPLAVGANGAYPPVEFTYGATTVEARTTFGPLWEGPPGLVHGGFLATGFDIALSTLSNRIMGPSVTRRLSLRYLRPTPLDTPLRFEAKAGEREGRLLHLSASLFIGDRVTMKATSQFVSLEPWRFDANVNSTS